MDCPPGQMKVAVLKYGQVWPCVRKLLNGLIMYIYPLKIKNIVLYCIVLLEVRLQF